MGQYELALIWNLILIVAWTVYLCLESFVVGVGMLQGFVSKDEKVQMSKQMSVGLHWNGIEVWLITAVGGTFAAFALAYAKILESLYIPFYLLLLAIILRGIGIELMYTLDSPRYRKNMQKIWMIGSFLIPLVIGVYFANIFIGLNLGPNGYEGIFLNIFTLTGIAGGLLLVTLSIVSGASWIAMTGAPGADHDKAMNIAKKTAIVSVLSLLIVYMGFNTKYGVFVDSQLYTSYPALWALPVLAIVSALAMVLFTFKKKPVLSFITVMTSIILYMSSAYVAIFPYLVPSRIDSQYGITIKDAMGSETALRVMFYVALVLVPLAIVYQTWKFIYFAKHKKKNKGQEAEH